MLKSELSDKLRERIKSSDLWGDRSRETASALSGLKCPECGRPEAWAYRDFPATVLCNRKNSCGAKVRTLELFPEVLENIERDFRPSKEDPHRPAREYLYSRGLTSKSLAGLNFEYRRNIRKCGSGGVMFYIGRNATGDAVWNGRIFSPPQGFGKTHNQGALVAKNKDGKETGLFWKHPGIVYDPNKPTYVTEAIIESLSLIEMGLQSISSLTAVTDPAKFDFSELGKGFSDNIVIALNPDYAGERGLKKWKTVYPEAKAVVPVSGDWNDFLVAKGAKASEEFARMLPEMECRANLLLAESARDYADIWTMHYGWPPGLFEFDRRYWWAQIYKGNGKGKESALGVSCVSNFVCETDHYAKDSSSAENSVYRYALQVRPADGQATFCSVAGTELADARSVRSALLTYARVTWTGDIEPTKALAVKIAGAKAPVVRQIYTLGHDRDSGCLVFKDFLIDPSGKFHTLDDRGFFRVSRKEFLRPPEIPSINPKRGGVSSDRIYQLLSEAWPYNAQLAVAYAVASWFVYSIKPELGFFPFLSLHGDIQTGKSRLIRCLNAMQALDEEGLPLTRLNTGKGEIRRLAQRSALFKALLEANSQEKIKFDLESLLTLYNHGNSLQVRAMKSNDLATKETEFLGTLIFSQNTEPFRTKAQMSRVISSWPFRSDAITDKTTMAYRELLKISLREMANVYVEIMANRKEIEAGWYAEYIKARDQILETVPDNRIAENYGLVLCFNRIAEKFFGAKNDLTRFVTKLAEIKHKQCNHRQATEADRFFEACDCIDPLTLDKFLEIKSGRVYVRLALALKYLGGNGYQFNPQLQKDLKEHPGFHISNYAYRGYWGGQVSEIAKTWVFDEAQVELRDTLDGGNKVTEW